MWWARARAATVPERLSRALPLTAYGLAALVIAIDLGSKYWALASLSYNVAEPVLPFWNWTLRYNTGAAFSFLAGQGGWQRWLFAVLAAGVSAMLAVWIWRTPRRLEAYSYALILGGALGNLYDRMRHGHVVDFIEWHAAGHYWPAFNFADSAICIGAALLMLHIVKDRGRA